MFGAILFNCRTGCIRVAVNARMRAGVIPSDVFACDTPATRFFSLSLVLDMSAFDQDSRDHSRGNPCGYYGDSKHNCRCTSLQIQNYRNKISFLRHDGYGGQVGPLLDRIFTSKCCPCAIRDRCPTGTGESPRRPFAPACWPRARCSMNVSSLRSRATARQARAGLKCAAMRACAPRSCTSIAS